MLIANPIYDTVFKYLMENLEIAKGIISAIIDAEILQLDFKAQESIYKSKSALTVYHLDFIARIRLKEGGFNTVLIELQKTNIPYDIMRFRRYVGEQYKKEDEIMLEDGTVSKEPLPIITIYFLGFTIGETLPAVIKVDRKYIDVLAGKEILERNDFIERLSHDSVVIQIPSLKLQMKSRLEWVLSIFQQEKFIGQGHYLKSYEHEPGDELMVAILRQLGKAAGDNELLRTLELEEQAIREYESAVGKVERQLAAKEKELEQKDKALEQKDKTIAEKEKYIRELLEKLEKKT